MNSVLRKSAVFFTRSFVRPLSISTKNHAERPGSYLNGPDGRVMEKVPTHGPESGDVGYNSHEYYNHDKVSFYDAIADCNHMRLDVPDAGMIDNKR